VVQFSEAAVLIAQLPLLYVRHGHPHSFMPADDALIRIIVYF
jgi:hypothetical protein